MGIPKIKIIIVDDNRTFLESVEFYLKENDNYLIFNKAFNGDQVFKIKDIQQADIVLMDIEMPKMDGIEITKQLLHENKELKVIALTNYEEKVYLYSLIASGFKGCVHKKNTFNHLDLAIKTVIKGGLFFPDSFTFT